MLKTGRLPLVFAVVLSGCASSAYRGAPPDGPHAEVHFRLLQMQHTTEALTEVIRVDRHRVRERLEYPGAPFGTSFVRTSPDELLELEVGVRYDQDVPASRRALRSALIASDEVRDNIAGWSMFFEDQRPAGQCLARLQLRPEAGAQYLVEYRYFDDGRCAARCRRVYGDINVPKPVNTTHCRGLQPRWAASPEDRRPTTLEKRLQDLVDTEFEGGLLSVTSSRDERFRVGDQITQIGYEDFDGRQIVIEDYDAADLETRKLHTDAHLVLRVLRDGEAQTIAIDN